jgi:hypothetical protein
MTTMQEIETLMTALADREVSCRLTRNRGLSVYPRSRLNKDLLKRIKRHKREQWGAWNSAGRRSRRACVMPQARVSCARCIKLSK